MYFKFLLNKKLNLKHYNKKYIIKQLNIVSFLQDEQPQILSLTSTTCYFLSKFKAYSPIKPFVLFILFARCLAQV